MLLLLGGIPFQRWRPVEHLLLWGGVFPQPVEDGLLQILVQVAQVLIDLFVDAGEVAVPQYVPVNQHALRRRRRVDQAGFSRPGFLLAGESGFWRARLSNAEISYDEERGGRVEEFGCPLEPRRGFETLQDSERSTRDASGPMATGLEPG